MDKEIVSRLHSSFEDMVRKYPETGTEYWCARDLQMLLGYTQWRSFAAVIDKAITACKASKCEPKDHFAHIRKMVDLGSGARREIEDIGLTRYACYLIAQNGDPGKEPIAFAQTYFAVQTRKQEIIEQRMAEAERISVRKKLTQSEKELSGIIFERLKMNESFGRIRSKGDTALFGGRGRKKSGSAVDIRRFQADLISFSKPFGHITSTFNSRRESCQRKETLRNPKKKLRP